MILKERAIRAKKQKRDVVVLSLGSCDAFGTPLKYPLVYDIFTKREMQNLGISFYNAVELGRQPQDGKYCSVEKDNRQFVLETCRKVTTGDLTYPEMYTIFNELGIDIPNAGAYFNENKNNPNSQTQRMDVYIALIEFVKKNKWKDILVDEVPILMSPISKIICYYFKLSFLVKH